MLTDSPSGIPLINHGFIRNNGDIDPPVLPIKRNGNSYILTNNIQNYTLKYKEAIFYLTVRGSRYKAFIPIDMTA